MDRLAAHDPLRRALWGWLDPRTQRFRQRVPKALTSTAGIGCLMAGVICNPWTAGKVFGRTLDGDEAAKVVLVEVAALIAGVALTFSAPIRELRNLVACFWDDDPIDTSPEAQARGVMWHAFLVPWLAVSLAAAFLRYTWWLWGIECVVLALAVSYFPLRNGVHRCLGFAFAAVSLMVVSPTIPKARDVVEHGFAGERPVLTNIMDRLADDIRAADRTSATIGYHLFFNGYELFNSEFEPRYRIGGPFDLFLRMKYGIRNDDQSPRGFTSDDDYRVVEKFGYPNKHHLFPFVNDGRYRLLVEEGNYQVWKRDRTPN
ncbi:MAG: hypothetical protein QM811_02065 [Pirellulales bacterium]